MKISVFIAVLDRLDPEHWDTPGSCVVSPVVDVFPDEHGDYAGLSDEL